MHSFTIFKLFKFNGGMLNIYIISISKYNIKLKLNKFKSTHNTPKIQNNYTHTHRGMYTCIGQYTRQHIMTWKYTTNRTTKH